MPSLVIRMEWPKMPNVKIHFEAKIEPGFLIATTDCTVEQAVNFMNAFPSALNEIILENEKIIVYEMKLFIGIKPIP